MVKYVIGAVALLQIGAANAKPLLTAACEQPLGPSLNYGVSPHERAEASTNHLKEPTQAKLKISEKDGFLRKPTFIIDENKKDATVVWLENSEEAKEREQAKAANVPYCCSPPPAKTVKIVLFMPEQITFADIETNDATIYSLYPELGSVFISRQSIEPSGKYSTQMSTFAKCTIVWSEK